MKRIETAGVWGVRCERGRLLRLLGLSAADVVTPLTIIGAAQVRLRRVRQLMSRSAMRPRRACARLRQIREARDVLLRQGVASRLESAPPGDD